MIAFFDVLMIVKYNREIAIESMHDCRKIIIEIDVDLFNGLHWFLLLCICNCYC